MYFKICDISNIYLQIFRFHYFMIIVVYFTFLIDIHQTLNYQLLIIGLKITMKGNMIKFIFVINVLKSVKSSVFFLTKTITTVIPLANLKVKGTHFI